MIPSIQPSSTLKSIQSTRLNILWAFDGSEHSLAALQLIEDLHVDRISITAICVLPTQHFETYAAMQSGLDQAQKRLESRHVQVQTVLKTGNPAATINEYAQDTHSDLILIGAKGLRASFGILLGGVAQQVVEYSSRPVLVVRAPYRGLSRMLVVTDGSPSSQSLLDYIAPRCEPSQALGGEPLHCPWLPLDARLTVMNVLPPPVIDLPSMTWALGTEPVYQSVEVPIDEAAVEAEEAHQGRQILQQAQEPLQNAGFSVRVEMPRGDAATEILKYIQEHEISLVACGSRGLSPINSWLLGSVSRKLVHYAGCSVLIVK